MIIGMETNEIRYYFFHISYQTRKIKNTIGFLMADYVCVCVYAYAMFLEGNLGMPIKILNV